MRKMRTCWITLFLMAMGVLPTACLFGGRGGAPTHFHKLESLHELEPGRKALASLPEAAVAVGPINLAEYLNRPQIVTPTADNELRVNEFERWAEPLKSGVSRVIADNLALLLDTTRVAAVTSQAFPKTDYQVAIDISRLDGAPGEPAVLRARWRILSSGGGLRMSQGIDLNEPPPGNDFGSIVKAQSRLLARLSREIAGAIAGLAKN